MGSSQPVVVRVLGGDDVDVLSSVAPDVFDKPVDGALATEFLRDPRHDLAVALDEGRVVGMASGVYSIHPDKGPELWVKEVAVAEPYRRQRVGSALLEALFERARDLGCSEAWVLTDATNEPARRLYGGLGGSESPALMYSFSLRQPESGGDRGPR